MDDYIPSIHQLIRAHKSSRSELRYGQFFCNHYIRGNWTELYYCEDDEKSLEMIQ